MTFQGFSPEGLAFLTTLGTKDRTWFAANRQTYLAEVSDPAKAFVEAMGEALAVAVSPDIVATPKTNGSISPINNDVRFAKDASPYKDHLLFRFWEGANKKTAPTLYVRLSEQSVGFATGAPILSVDRWRELINDDSTGGDLQARLVALGKRRTLDVAGQALKKVPKPYDEDHPRAGLLKHKSFQARWPEATPKAVSSATFVGWCVKRLEAAAPVHNWLKQHKP